MLPNEIDGEHMTATFEKGLLKIHAPKGEATRPRKIVISKPCSGQRAGRRSSAPPRRRRSFRLWIAPELAAGIHIGVRRCPEETEAIRRGSRPLSRDAEWVDAEEFTRSRRGIPLRGYRRSVGAPDRVRGFHLREEIERRADPPTAEPRPTRNSSHDTRDTATGESGRRRRTTGVGRVALGVSSRCGAGRSAGTTARSTNSWANAVERLMSKVVGTRQRGLSRRVALTRF